MNRQLSVVASYESRYLSCPAVSHICRLVFSPSTSILFIWKSTPENRKADFQCLKSRTCQRHLIKCLLWNPPSVVWMSPLNSLRVSLSRKLDFPAPASPAKTRRYIGTGSSVSSMSASKGCTNVADDNKLTQFYMDILCLWYLMQRKGECLFSAMDSLPNLEVFIIIINMTEAPYLLICKYMKL